VLFVVKFFNTYLEDPENSAVTNHVILSGNEGDTQVYNSSLGLDDYQVPISSMPSQCAHAAATASLGRLKESSVLLAESKSHYSLLSPGFLPSLYPDPLAPARRFADSPPATSYGHMYD